MAFFIMIVVCVVLALTGNGKYVPLLFPAFIIFGMAFESMREGEGKSFAKIFIIPIALLFVLSLAVSQCSNSAHSPKSNSSGSWWKNNTCGKGAWFDEFSDGRGQWRNKDGKFCSR